MFHTDGVLFKNTFGTEEMRDIFTEERFIERFLEAEAALARAEADAGLIPNTAGEEITERASLDDVDLSEIEANVEEIHLFTMAIIKDWKENIGDVGEYVHWGATSQDISDTALMLQIREGFDVVRRDLLEIRRSLARLAESYADTPMIGRTHHVHATPITFGLKAATWYDEVDRHLERLDQLSDRLFVLQLFGATGTIASLGEAGVDVQERMAEELDLAVPDVAWFASRDRFAELVSLLAMITGTTGKIAQQLLMANREEIEELEEPIGEGSIGSSTMPHKRNPVRSEETVALSRMVRSHANLMNDLLSGHDERDFSTWVVEFAVIPEAFLYSSRNLRHTRDVLENLIVHPDRMERNVRHHGSLVASEAVMMAVAESVGRQTAHEIVHEAAIRALTEDADFKTLLLQDERIPDAFDEARLDELTEPTNYTGLAAELAARTIDE